MKTLIIENGLMNFIQVTVMVILMIGLLALVYLQYCEMRDREKRKRDGRNY